VQNLVHVTAATVFESQNEKAAEKGTFHEYVVGSSLCCNYKIILERPK
jgi:hypothetical protein